MNIGVILAGGTGRRFCSDIPKQFIDVMGRPVIAYTIEAFQNHEDIDAILVVCVKAYMDYMKEIREKFSLTKIKWLTEGGSTFQESVINAVNYLEGKINDDDILVIHFAASPFIEKNIISDSVRVSREKGNAISATDYYILSGRKHSTKSVSDSENYSDEYIDRDTIACMSTPHSFRYGFIRDMYREAAETGIINTVEPHTTTLMYAMGKKIYFSAGSQINIKITRKEDLELFKGYILARSMTDPS